MRHYPSMKALIASLLLLFGYCAWAEEAADRTAINKTIAALNEIPPHPDLFTPDADGHDVLNRLRKGKRFSYKTLGRPTVVISHEPWGEATIDYGGGGEIVNPRIVSRKIRIVTSEVALVDGAFTYEVDSTESEMTPLLFVMKKDGRGWRIASVRVLASTSLAVAK